MLNMYLFQYKVAKYKNTKQKSSISQDKKDIRD